MKFNLTTQQVNGQTMSSLEIAELTGKRHDHVCTDIKRILEEAEIDTPVFMGTQNYGNGNTRTVYNLPKRECDLVVSGYSVKYRLAIIDRWIELENKSILPQNLPEALRAYAIEVEKNEALSISNKNKDSLIIASNEASIKAGEITITEFVKSVDLISVGRKIFYKWMRDQEIIFKHSGQPFQHFVNKGYFTYKPTSEEYNGKVRMKLMVTPRGKIWLSAKYMNWSDQQDLLI